MGECERLSKEFPVVIEIPVAWGEIDSLGHVNNIVYFRYFESVRMVYLERIGFLTELEKSGVGPILASTRCDFRKPLTYPDTISVGGKTRELGSDRFVMQYRVVSHKLGKVAAEGEGLLMSYDYRGLRRAPIPDKVHDAIRSLEALEEGKAALPPKARARGTP